MIYSVDVASGQEQVLHNFRGKRNGTHPYNGLVALPADPNGNRVFGEASAGGSSNRGAIFSFDLATHRLKTLYSFSGDADGALPYSQLNVANGIFYGNTATGGDHRKGTVFSFKP